MNDKVIAGRGKGKSTMISHILDKLEIDSADRPVTGSTETTIIQCPYKIKDEMFIWDMPGLGGKSLLRRIPYKIVSLKVYESPTKNNGMIF